MDAADILKRIRRIEIVTKNLVTELFGGQYHSLFKGQGLDFAEVRPYTEGDNFRWIDWNVSARMNQPFVKKFEETRELNLVLVIDRSASTWFGTRQLLKAEFMAELAGVLAFSALANHDKVGLLMYSDQIERWQPPRKGKSAALRIIRDIIYHQATGKGTNTGAAIEFLLRVVPKRSIVFIISDFFNPLPLKPLRVLARKHDVVALQVLDNAEVNLPDAGYLNIVDPESGNRCLVNTSNPGLRRRWQTEVQKKQEELETDFKRLQIDLLTLFSNQPYVGELKGLFHRRLLRRRHVQSR